MNYLTPHLMVAMLCLRICASLQAGAQGNCTSFDLDYICQNTEYVQAVSLDCGLACLNDGVVGASDLLIFLSEFGLGCN